MTSIRLGDPWDGDALGYDEWKTRLPDSWYADEPQEPHCFICEDVGSVMFDADSRDDSEDDAQSVVIVPCPLCSSECTLWDLEQEQAEQQAPERQQALRQYMATHPDV